MAECKTCGNFLHEEATMCPSCRDPDPVLFNEKNRQRDENWRTIRLCVILVPGVLMGLHYASWIPFFIYVFFVWMFWFTVWRF